MGFFDKIFGSKEEIEYKITLAKVSNPLIDKIDEIGEKEVRDFFKVILDATERSLRGILFMDPEEFNFKRELTKEEIDFWLRKVSLALVAYSYYFFLVEEKSSFAQFSYEAYWHRMFNSYNKIFDENITIDDINHYAAGLKEDTEKGYSKSGDIEKILELTSRDYKTLGAELLHKIWKKEVSSNDKKALFLGTRIWQAHQQIVQPFLLKLLSDY